VYFLLLNLCVELVFLVYIVWCLSCRIGVVLFFSVDRIVFGNWVWLSLLRLLVTSVNSSFW